MGKIFEGRYFVNVYYEGMRVLSELFNNGLVAYEYAKQTKNDNPKYDVRIRKVA